MLDHRPSHFDFNLSHRPSHQKKEEKDKKKDTRKDEYWRYREFGDNFKL